MKKNLTFEEAMLSLEDIVKKLENGGLSLDDSLKAFEEAVDALDRAERQNKEAKANV